MPQTRASLARNSRQKALNKVREKRWQQSSFPTLSNDAKEPVGNPVLRSCRVQEDLDGNYVVNLKKLMEGLKKCKFCESQLSLEHSTKPPSRVGLGVVVFVTCEGCGRENRIQAYESHRTGSRGPEAVALNTMSALAMLHTGQGHTHLNADLSILGIGSISSDTFKKREREVGLAIESVCQKSCEKWKEKERVSATTVDSEGNSLISVSYDGAWQKRGKSRDSTTGFGTVIGENTGNILDYGVKCTRCRICEATKSGNDPTPHDCRKNFNGSSKAMEPEIAVECFNAATKCGLKYSEYIGDEDTTTECHVKYRVSYDIVKRTDKNHATRTLGSRLYAAQKNVKGLTAGVIHYITKLFAYCVSQNQGNQEKISTGLKVLVSHAFGDHAGCDSNWCGSLKDPTNYKHKDLPGGKPLNDENLRAAIENAIQPFQTTEWCAKLANCGSSQSNESVNGIVGTKAPKIRHYGSSESLSFRVSSGICQFNEGPNYLTNTTKELGIAPEKIKSQFVDSLSHKRKRDHERHASVRAKRRRKELKKARPCVKKDCKGERETLMKLELEPRPKDKSSLRE